MDTPRRRFIRLAIVTATAAGVALASPVVAVADESDVIGAAPIDESSDLPVVMVPTMEPMVIELIVEGNPPTGTTQSPVDAVFEGTVEADPMPAATESGPAGADPTPMIAALEMSSEDEHTGGAGGSHTEGSGGEHTGGGQTGDPYEMTFEVSWRLPDDSIITALDDELPTDWRTIFDLAAAGATGGGKPTSAHCTYPPGSSDLVCEFENPGKHASVTDGMIVPAKPTATYTVTVLWPVSGWTIEGANAGPYSARDLCPRGGGGGGGHDSGHDSGHGETLAALEDSGHGETLAGLEDSGSVCLHTVVMRKSAVIPEPPPVVPPAQDPPVSEVPAAVPPPSQTPAPPAAAPAPPAIEVLPVSVTPRALPATGNTATTTLMIGTIILAVGGCLLVLSRRRTDLPLT